MATRSELDRELDGIQKELYTIVANRALRVPDCAIEEFAVYLATGEIPTLYDWKVS